MNHLIWDPIFGIYALMASFVAGAACLLIWAVRSGAMTASEAPKYRMLEDDDAPAGEGADGTRDGGDHDGQA